MTWRRSSLVSAGVDIFLSLYNFLDILANPRGHTSHLYDACGQAFFLHVTHAIYIAILRGNNLRPAYFRKQVHFLLYPPRNLCGTSAGNNLHLVYFRKHVHFLLFLLNNLCGMLNGSSGQYPIFTHIWKEDSWIHTFPKDINAIWNANSLFQDVNSYHRVHIYIYTEKETRRERWTGWNRQTDRRISKK